MNPYKKIKFPCRNLTTPKQFFTTVFGWAFTDYTSEYAAFSSDCRAAGRFYQSLLTSTSDNGATLTIFYSYNLTNTKNKIKQHDGTIIKTKFSFPVGQIFHFGEPSNNELAV